VTPALLNLVRAPLLLVDDQGEVQDANDAGRTFMDGPSGPGAGLIRDPALAALLKRTRGGSSSLPGRIAVSINGQTESRSCRATLIRRLPAPLIALEIIEEENNRFSALNRKIGELNAEISNRLSALTRAQETAATNQLLFRELQHRVKNQLQMVLAIFSAARREAGPQQGAIFDKVEGKLRAIFEAQKATFYDSDMGQVASRRLIAGLAESIRPIVPPGIRLLEQADDSVVHQDHAYALALLINELLTNAVKYGCPGDEGEVTVSLTAEGSDLVLRVTDAGPGFDPSTTGSRSSGLGLVQGLCRQIGGRFDIESRSGTCVLVSFPREVGPK
jgi:two-component sensor histidine kinase